MSHSATQQCAMRRNKFTKQSANHQSIDLQISRRPWQLVANKMQTRI